eukprot:976334-Prorocentrum_minimum.AAC.1
MSGGALFCSDCCWIGEKLINVFVNYFTVIIGAVIIVVVDTIGPHNCPVRRHGDKGPSVRSEGATGNTGVVSCEDAEAGPIASAPHACCEVHRPCDEGPSVW